MLLFVLNKTNIDSTFLEILTSPKGRTIDLSFNIDKSLLSSLSRVGDVKLF